ncbi:MAG: EamA family transporter [Chloroflexi bacterium]|nr:EamA family transporter [Chloroflexota bacterium]
MSQRNKAIIALVVTAVLWSSGGVLIKWVNWHPMAIVGTRSAIAAVLLWVIARRPRFKWSPALIGGAVAYAVTVMLYVPAVTLTTAANAILLQYTAPLWIALFGAWFLGERATWIDWLCILVSLGGMALFFHEGLASKSFAGDLLGALSGITLAWSMLLLRKQKDGTPLECVLLGNVLAALGGLPFVFGRPVPNAMGWLALLYLGVVQLGLAYALYAWAIKHVTALESVLIVMLEPILNPIWALLLIGERPQGWALVGGLLVLAAATVRGVLLAVHKPHPAAASAESSQAAAP